MIGCCGFWSLLWLCWIVLVIVEIVLFWLMMCKWRCFFMMSSLVCLVFIMCVMGIFVYVFIIFVILFFVIVLCSRCCFEFCGLFLCLEVDLMCLVSFCWWWFSLKSDWKFVLLMICFVVCVLWILVFSFLYLCLIFFSCIWILWILLRLVFFVFYCFCRLVNLWCKFVILFLIWLSWLWVCFLDFLLSCCVVSLSCVSFCCIVLILLGMLFSCIVSLLVVLLIRLIVLFGRKWLEM